ncbi:MAG: hypothetical protein GW855_05425 [Erythrobacter sp.]|nr:hypothetical protein [Erythrobacter sp.]NCQ63656.1 hypothetical protein [Alphaproteobacteria bacterium]
MSDDPHAEAQEAVAARRYWTLQFVRLAGIFLTFIGAMMVVDRIDGGALGPVLFVAGPLLFFAVPVLLARKWKSGR